jgi:hypothetical protein
VSYLGRFARFCWEFVVGDDLALALGAGAALGLTALVVHEGVNAWWLLPVAVVVLLAGAVLREAARGSD